MSYPGNSSLSSAVKDRVLSTFQQTLALYKQGRTDEVASGCNLILQMDPQFDPARKLLDKSRNPNLPIDVDRLVPVNDAPALQQAREAMAARDFQRVIHLTTEILTDDLMNDEARVLGDDAREKLEAAPFVDQFVRKANQAIAAGNTASARQDLEKARQLDPTHPEVIRIARAVEGAAAPAPAQEPQAFSFDASPSFVVDTPKAPAGRNTAQAADFGFTFEEEKPAAPAAPVTDFSNFSFDSPSPATDAPFAGFSFDAPATPAPTQAPTAPAPAAEFDFATASVSTTPDDQKKIDQYLADGDRAAEAGDYQQAIDLWSRIFLIDVTNDAASERIERAKLKRREIEAKVETALGNAVTAFDRKDLARARDGFTEVLRIDPANATAHDYLARLDAADTPAAAAFAPPAPSYDESPSVDFFEEEPPSGYDSPLMPPEPMADDDDEAAEVAAPAKGKAAKKKTAPAKTAPAPATGRKAPMGLILGVVGLLVLLAAGWYVWTNVLNKSELDPAATQAIFTRADSLARQGRYDQAIAVLQDVKPEDPQHDRALEMIADLQAKRSKSAEMIDGRPASVYYEEKVAAARVSFDAHDYLAAKTAFEDAMKVKQLPPDVKASYDTAAQQVAKLDAAKALFQERKYSEALANLQQLATTDPDNKNIRRMIVDAHFNLGAQVLQSSQDREPLDGAIREFDEVLKLDPSDELARRSKDLAVRYDNQPRDLLYKIYVKYLPLRQAA